MSDSIIITGGRGFIGSALTEALSGRGRKVVVLSRRKGEIISNADVELWDGQTVGEWARQLNGADAVINLAGENLAAGRWTPRRKQAILASRVESTQSLVRAMEQASPRPGVLIQASAVGFYGDNGDDVLDENAACGEGFLAGVCRQWEQAAQPAGALGVRLVIMRLGVVLGRSGGMMERLVPLFRRGLGGPWGSGRQWLSWIHLADIISAIEYFLHTPTAQGVYNLASPRPVPVREFARCLGEALHRPAVIKAPATLLRLTLGEMADEMLLAGRRVEPKRLVQDGFGFMFADLKDALKDII